MKNLFRISMVLFGMLASSSVSAACCPAPCAAPVAAEPCRQEATGECWCKFVKYEPRYTQCPRCVEKQVPCKKTCCRYVDQNYEVQRCRYVPQYYTETLCRKVPEYYEVCETKCEKEWIQETKCDYVPRYFWKHTCGEVSDTCPTGRCGN